MRGREFFYLYFRAHKNAPENTGFSRFGRLFAGLANRTDVFLTLWWKFGSGGFCADQEVPPIMEDVFGIICVFQGFGRKREWIVSEI